MQVLTTIQKKAVKSYPVTFDKEAMFHKTKFFNSLGVAKYSKTDCKAPAKKPIIIPTSNKCVLLLIFRDSTNKISNPAKAPIDAANGTPNLKNKEAELPPPNINKATESDAREFTPNT